MFLSILTLVRIWNRCFSSYTEFAEKHRLFSRLPKLCQQIWYLDLWQNFDRLDKESEQVIRGTFGTRESYLADEEVMNVTTSPNFCHTELFEGVSSGHWQWLISVAVLTALAAAFFILIELFRETQRDWSNQVKGRGENILEGLCFGTLVLAWMPTVVFATAPGGPASLIGNAYFFTWLCSIFVFEGLVWFIHDMRKDLHRALKEKEDEYRRRQRQVLEETKRIQRYAKQETSATQNEKRDRSSTEYFDSVAGM